MLANDRKQTLESIHDSAVDAIITIGHSGIIETVNPATETLFGYRAEEMIGNNISMLMPQPYRNEHDGYLKNYLRTGEKKIIGIGREVAAEKSNGEVFPIHLAVSEVKLADRVVFAGFIRDLTHFRRIEAQQTTLGRIIEDSLNEVFVFDAKTLKFMLVNRGARENLGYTDRELGDMTPVELKPDFTAEEFEQRFLQPLRQQTHNRIKDTTRHRRKDGSLYDVEVHLQKASFMDTEVFVAIVLDITDQLANQQLIQQQQQSMRQQLEQEVSQRTAQLHEAQKELVRSEKYSMLGKVAGGIAHEIRNPLNAVKTSSYYLLNAKSPPSEKVAEHLRRIDRQVTMIDNVVTALSDVARMPEANRKPVDAAALIKNVVQSVNMPSSIKVEFVIPNDLPWVHADSNQISIAFRNLIRNARDAMPDGGNLRITATPVESAVEFAVSDDGVGISPADLERILEPLYTTKARGMGLGLAITNAIVEKNLGVLTVLSTLEQGSTFTIKLRKI